MCVLYRILESHLKVFLGPTGSGKTVICLNIIKDLNTLVHPAPIEILYNYSVWQPAYDEMKAISSIPIKFTEGLTSYEELAQDRKPRLWIIDDLMDDAGSSQVIVNAFTKYSHHMNYSVILLTQNLFSQGLYFRTISLNSQYLWLLKSVRDTSIISTLGRQMGNERFLKECYKDATRKPHSHLFIDLKPGSDDKYRVRSNIFDSPITVYVKKSKH